jgi:hypothetical protein
LIRGPVSVAVSSSDEGGKDLERCSWCINLIPRMTIRAFAERRLATWVEDAGELKVWRSLHSIEDELKSIGAAKICPVVTQAMSERDPCSIEEDRCA